MAIADTVLPPSKTVGASSDLYERRSDWLDKQISKAVLGQTATTDAVTGGLGSGKEHRQVQEDIERADARALSAVLNRDLVRPWIDLEFGPQDHYPRLAIARPESEDLTALATQLGVLVPLGLKVSKSNILGRFGLVEPHGEDDVLGETAVPPAPDAPGTVPVDPKSKIKRNPAVIKWGEAVSGAEAALQAEAPVAGKNLGGLDADPETLLTDRLEVEGAPAMAGMIDQIEIMLQAAGSLEEFQAMLLAGFPKVDSSALAQAIALGLIAADLSGRVDVEAAGG